MPINLHFSKTFNNIAMCLLKKYLFWRFCCQRQNSEAQKWNKGQKSFLVFFNFYDQKFVEDRTPRLLPLQDHYFHIISKVMYHKYSKHWPYTVAYTIDCVCSKMLNHGFFHSHFKLTPCPINWIACICVSLF